MAANAKGGVTNRSQPSILLGLLILSWAISWPAIKVGVATMPPIRYACFRYANAACAISLVIVRAHRFTASPLALAP